MNADPAADLDWPFLTARWDIRAQAQRESTERLVGRAKLDLETALWPGERKDPRLRPWLLRRARELLREALARGVDLHEAVLVEREASVAA